MNNNMMTYGEFVKRTATVFGMGVAILAFWYLRDILMIAFLSSIIAISLSIPVDKLQQYGVRRGFAIAITIIGVVTAIALFMTWIFPVMIEQIGSLADDLPSAFETTLNSYSDWREKQSDTVQDVLPDVNQDNIMEFIGFDSTDDGSAAGDEAPIDTSQITNFALPVLVDASNFLLAGLGNLFLVVAVSIFMLIDPMDYAKGFVTIIPPAYRKRVVELMVQLKITVTTWMAALSISISITTFLVWLVIGMILGVPNALGLGVIAGMASIIPNIGAIIPIAPLVIFTLADDPQKLPFVLVAYLLIQQVESNLITPTIVKRQLNIPAGALFLFQIISATIFGVLGVILAVPLLAVIMTLIREIYLNDVLDMQGEEVKIETTEEGHLKLVTQTAEMPPVEVVVLDETDNHRAGSDVDASPD